MPEADFPSLKTRLRFYIHYGVIGWIATIVILTFFHGELTPLCALVFNALLWRKFRAVRKANVIGSIAAMLTFLLFMIQYQYLEKIEWGCLRFTSSQTANLNYASTMVVFSLMIWELGFIIIERRNCKRI